MTGFVPLRPSPRSPAPAARFGAALAASAVAHWMLLTAPLLDLQWRAIAPVSDGAPLTVRLAPVPAGVPESPLRPYRGARRMPPPAKPWSGDLGSLLGGDSIAGTGEPVLAPALDPHYYTARDLDDFPRPLAPLRIDRRGGDGVGEVRLEVLIDERGVVQEVIFTGPARPGQAQEALRAALATTLFLPARKDGRAVKSRVTLRLGFDPEDGER